MASIDLNKVEALKYFNLLLPKISYINDEINTNIFHEFSKQTGENFVKLFLEKKECDPKATIQNLIKVCSKNQQKAYIDFMNIK